MKTRNTLLAAAAFATLNIAAAQTTCFSEFTPLYTGPGTVVTGGMDDGSRVALLVDDGTTSPGANLCVVYDYDPATDSWIQTSQFFLGQPLAPTFGVDPGVDVEGETILTWGAFINTTGGQQSTAVVYNGDGAGIWTPTDLGVLAAASGVGFNPPNFATSFGSDGALGTVNGVAGTRNFAVIGDFEQDGIPGQADGGMWVFEVPTAPGGATTVLANIQRPSLSGFGPFDSEFGQSVAASASATMQLGHIAVGAPREGQNDDGFGYVYQVTEVAPTVPLSVNMQPSYSRQGITTGRNLGEDCAVSPTVALFGGQAFMPGSLSSGSLVNGAWVNGPSFIGFRAVIDAAETRVVTQATDPLGVTSIRQYAPDGAGGWTLGLAMLQGTDLIGTSGPLGGVGMNSVIRTDCGGPFGTGTSYCTSTNSVSTLSATGSLEVSVNATTLVLTGLQPATFGFYITSQDQGVVQNPAGSLGTLCLGGAIGRYVGPGEIFNTGTGTSNTFTIDLNNMPQPQGFVAAAPGETWNFQGWYRIAGQTMAQSTFSNGLELLIQ